MSNRFIIYVLYCFYVLLVHIQYGNKEDWTAEWRIEGNYSSFEMSMVVKTYVGNARYIVQYLQNHSVHFKAILKNERRYRLQ